MLATLAAEAEQGLLPALTKEPAFAAAVASPAYANLETAPVAPVADTETEAVQIEAFPTGELVVTYAAPDTEPVAVVVDEAATEPLAVVDDRTRPIELPPKGDNELF